MKFLFTIDVCVFIVILTCLSYYTAETQQERMELEPEELFVYNDNMTDGDEVLTIEASFQPLLISTMKREALPKKKSTERTLTSLRSWTNVNFPWKNFGAADFKGFIPPSDDVLGSMQPYDVISQTSDIHKHFRYNPPLLDTNIEITLHKLLSLLQPRPFIYTRSGAHGVVACVSAYNTDHLEISYRIHAEFQLNEPPLPPVWFVPAQLSGRLILEKQARRVLYFDMAVPQDRHPNVALEWLSAAKENEFGNLNQDIGYLPEMSLKATRDSLPMYNRGRHFRKKYLNTTADYADVISSIQWDNEITNKEASLRIATHMYPFLKLHHHNFTTVWPEAQRIHKPVHFIVSQDYLDDQTSSQSAKYLRGDILEDEEVTDILQKHFVYGWCVFNDLKVLELSDQHSSNMKKLTSHYVSNYKSPFVAVVALSNGKIVTLLDLGNIFNQPTERRLNYNAESDNPAKIYIDFLKSGLEEATAQMLLEDYNHDEL